MFALINHHQPQPLKRRENLRPQILDDERELMGGLT